MGNSQDESSAEQQEAKRDELLRRLLNTPPQPRPKRDRGKGETKTKQSEKDD